MLCMLFRKYLCGGRVLAVRRIAGDRILEIDVSNLSELGDPVTRTLVVEIMGRHSNIILRTEDGRIIDAARHVGPGYLPRASGDAGLAVCLSADTGKA